MHNTTKGECRGNGHEPGGWEKRDCVAVIAKIRIAGDGERLISKEIHFEFSMRCYSKGDLMLGLSETLTGFRGKEGEMQCASSSEAKLLIVVHFSMFYFSDFEHRIRITEQISARIVWNLPFFIRWNLNHISSVFFIFLLSFVNIKKFSVYFCKQNWRQISFKMRVCVKV